MSLVYLQSMYSESCFSERSRNKQALFLLKVSKLASVAQHVSRSVVPLWFGPLAGLPLWLLFLIDSETCTGTNHPLPPSHPLHLPSCLPNLHMPQWILDKLRWLLARLWHDSGGIFHCLQSPTPAGTKLLFSFSSRDRHLHKLFWGVWL